MDSDKPNVTVAKLHTFGWQRRVDLDTSVGQVWESPDGKLQMFPYGVEPMVARFKTKPLWWDKEVGSK